MPEPIAAAPAQPEPVATPEPISAVDHAVAGNDVASFREARRAERAGTPLPAVEPTDADDALDEPIEVAPVAAEPGRQLSKRQQQMNDSIRDAVDRATRDMNAEIARLRAQVGEPKPATPQTAPAPTKEADHKRYLAMPDAPKLEQFDSIEEHSAAMAVFIADKRYEERETARQQTDAQTQRANSLKARDEAFNARIKAAKEADPTFYEKLSEDVKGLRPRTDLTPAERPGPLNDVADFILGSDAPEPLMRHFSEHPEDLKKFEALKSPADVHFHMGLLVGTLQRGAPSQPTTKIVTDAPDPHTNLGRKPTVPTNEVDAAVQSNDVGAYRRARLRERTAQMR